DDLGLFRSISSNNIIAWGSSIGPGNISYYGFFDSLVPGAGSGRLLGLRAIAPIVMVPPSSLTIPIGSVVLGLQTSLA
ncbi:MAG: hypothetical protein ACRC78_25800, partial [Planktothrix sp.]